MSAVITHIDVGYSRQYAAISGDQPSTLILCGAKDGDTIRDDRIAIAGQGGYPAACNCSACQEIAGIMHACDCTPKTARKTYAKRSRAEVRAY